MRNQGIFAPHFHISPEKGLLNDPNGLSFFKGEYHVFYQYNPYGTDHATKYWGHLKSKNLQDWEQAPIALKSEDWFDKDGVYSGGAIVHEDTLYLFYTGNTKDEKGIRTSYQCMATSQDGIHFTKHGPILEQAPGFTGHVRDPKVWYDPELEGWWMILGAQRIDKTGDTIAYFSKDLKNWDYKGSILQFESPLGYMWECPDLVFLFDQVTGQDKAVFIFSPQGIEPEGDDFHNIFNTTYLVGTWDNRAAKFIPDQPDLIEVDRGFEFYAPQTFVDPQDRVIQYAWAGTMWPEVEAAVPSRQDGWIHLLTQPRQLVLKGGRLFQEPLSETEGLVRTSQQLGSDRYKEIDLKGPSRLQVTVDVQKDFQIKIDHAVNLTYVADTHRVTVQRQRWLDGQQESRSYCLSKELETLDFWIDASLIEVFVNDGEASFTQQVFSNHPLSQVALSGDFAKVVLSDLRGYTYQS